MLRIAILHEERPARPGRITPELKEKISSAGGGADVFCAGSEEELIKICPDAEVLCCWAMDCPSEWISGAKSLKWIQSMSAGIEKLQPVRDSRPDVVITGMKGVFCYPMAESAVMYILMLLRGMPFYIRCAQERVWRKPLPENCPKEAAGQTVGIVGMGEIGSHTAKKCRALGMKVLGCRRRPSGNEPADRMYSAGELPDMLPQCDIVLLFVPASEKTNKMFGRELFGFFKEGSYFINMGRGSVVDEEALCEALKDGRIAGAALDVFEQEPLPKDSPLHDLDNVIITPHSSALSPLNMGRAVDTFCNNIKRFINSERLIG
ncbi:MAG: D-2-hydroxyacid dehydrogenase [Firmicutes bacterium]|nr:D-2-hydroxyacid dehydrogenase [Bacillota bacterium]